MLFWDDYDTDYYLDCATVMVKRVVARTLQQVLLREAHPSLHMEACGYHI
jgi:hypothetical protein